MSLPNTAVPSELKLSKAWDLCIERAIYRTVIGTAIGGMAAIVLFRTPARRFGCTMFGTGFGAGSAWGFSAIDFENEKK